MAGFEVTPHGRFCTDPRGSHHFFSLPAVADQPSEGIAVTLPNAPKVLAISFANDEEAKELADDIGAVRLLDKMELSETLVPVILELAPSRSLAC